MHFSVLIFEWVKKKMYTNNYSKYLIKITSSSKLLNNSDQNYDGKTWWVYVKKK